MKLLYLDCRSGIAGDMVLTALKALGAGKTVIQNAIQAVKADSVDSDTHRSYAEIKTIIINSDLKPGIKKTALAVYYVVAKAEAQVHDTKIEEVHFHEVGRNQALANIVGSAAALDALKIVRIYCSAIHDGRGYIQCSHGIIPVPVPAVMAMRKDCRYPFIEEPVETELVTPTGLAILLGTKAIHSNDLPAGQIIGEAQAKGKRDTGKSGLKAILIKTPL